MIISLTLIYPLDDAACNGHTCLWSLLQGRLLFHVQNLTVIILYKPHCPDPYDSPQNPHSLKCSPVLGPPYFLPFPPLLPCFSLSVHSTLQDHAYIRILFKLQRLGPALSLLTHHYRRQPRKLPFKQWPL